jgi:acyl-CoA thioester hydrolase
MRPQFPAVEDVLQLPSLLERQAPPEWEDQNGHVNIQYYMQLYCEAGWPLMGRIGLDENYFEERRKGFFDLEHHLFYLAEIHVGDQVAVHGRFIGHSEKRFHAMMFAVNCSRGRLASTLEFITSGADLESRRAAPYPQDVAETMARLVSEHSEFSWPPPLCGIMSV